MALRYHPRNLRSINLKTPPTEQFSDGDVALFVCKDSNLGARKLTEMDKNQLAHFIHMEEYTFSI